MDASNLIRISRPLTKIIGPEFQTSMENIEIDITFKCNLRCYNCDRSCTQAPDDSTMSLDQIRKFIAESVATGRKWKRIRVLGGEPTLHPQFFDIIGALTQYKDTCSPATKIEITSNGYGKEVNSILEKISRDLWVNNTRKVGRFQKKFEAFNLAPADHRVNCLTDYTNGCWITQDCGIGLNRYGYYQCAVAGSIDRVFGFDIGLKTIPVEGTELKNQKRTLCKYCGHFFQRKYVQPDNRIAVDGEPKSKSWIGAYEKYKKSPPNLKTY